MSRLALVAAIAAALAALLAAACSGGGGSDGPAGEKDANSGLTRTAEAGGVTVKATWLTAESLDGVDADLASFPLEEFVLVEIDFTTHSGNLNQIDMEQASSLRQDGADIKPARWISLSDDSHHRAGIQVFPRNLEDGPVELTIEIGDEELALDWEAAPTT